MKKIKAFASCEKCGLNFTKLNSVTRETITCPKCKKRTFNFDFVNHNPRTRFKNYK